VRLGVIISDSFGRPWRLGTVGTAIGVAGPPGVVDRRGDPDLWGRKLQITEVGFADAVAAAAVLVMGEGDEGCPVVVVRGCAWTESAQSARNILRPRAEDLFR
jgi:coenzyme F420-0:L-glutamate ligase/coenzyme F420-1:gamma-L-glutamate ligase